MPPTRTAPGLSAEAAVAAVRMHADRVHDAVRRQGASEPVALEILEKSALDAIDRARSLAEDTNALVGWWFARARALGLKEPQDGGALPLGSGLLAGDSEQELLAEALELRPERERTALLLRDAYDLPAEVVGAALGTDPDTATSLVGRARMRLLPDVYDTEVPSLSGHSFDEASLARLAEGGPVAARDATTRRHAQTCPRCRPVIEAQDDARRLLAGLSVVALPDAEREHLLALVEARAAAVLPSSEELSRLDALLADADDEPLPRRLFAPIPVILTLFLATVIGLFIGSLLANDGGPAVAARQNVPPVTAPAPLSVAAPAPPAPNPALPTTRVFTLPPTTPPTSPPTTAPPTTTAAPAEGSITIDPASGPNGTTVTVTGTGWQPGVQVALEYRQLDGTSAGPLGTGFATPDETGAFTAQLTLTDVTGATGEHVVVAADGTTTTQAAFTAT